MTTPRTVAPLERVTRWAGVFAIAVGVLAIVGWAFDISLLKGAGPITMKPNAAIGLMACGISLLATAVATARAAVTGVFTAALAAALGAVTLSEHVFGWDLGIDQFLFQEEPGALATASPGRMGPNAASSFVLNGIALLVLHYRTRRAAVVAQWLALVTAMFATVPIVGYLYGAQALYSVARYTGIAWPTAVTLLVIACGIFFARPGEGPASAVVSSGPGGIMARRMLVPVLLVPIILGYLRVIGERAQLYDMGLGSALIAVVTFALFALAVWRTALRLDAMSLSERAAREEAERASRLKDEFLATLSHELRTPLNVILGWGGALRSGALPDERRRQAADMIVRNGTMLARLVEDLLDVSRISNARVSLSMRPVDVVQVASAAVLAADAAAAAKGIQLVARLDGTTAMVAGDPERLQQVVGNVLSNALKFTPPGGKVEVEALVRETSVDLRVRDTGQGIAPDFLPHVFERFRQEDATSTREHGGLGLGLSIVRELTELHGGAVSASSDGQGHGSTFTVTLPLLRT